jgi:hypothetical protein
VSDGPWGESLSLLSRYYVGAATLEETLTQAPPRNGEE